MSARGSSPCVWGQDEPTDLPTIGDGIIPMRVGTSDLFERLDLLAGDHPHACGDKRAINFFKDDTKGSSPCVWGQESPTTV